MLTSENWTVLGLYFQILQICTNLANMLTSLQAHCGRGPDLPLFPVVIGR
jgi:hypothetical protein